MRSFPEGKVFLTNFVFTGLYYLRQLEILVKKILTMISNLFSRAIFQSKLNHSLNFFLCLKNGEDFMSKKFFAIQIVLIFSFVGCGDKNDYVGELNN